MARTTWWEQAGSVAAGSGRSPQRGELQLLLLYPQPCKQDVLAHKRKVFTLSSLFPEFQAEEGSGRNRDGAVEVLTWALPLAGAEQRWGPLLFQAGQGPSVLPGMWQGELHLG